MLYLTGISSLCEMLYDQYLQNPESVDASWKDYFERLETQQSLEVYNAPTVAKSVSNRLPPLSSSSLRTEPWSDSLRVAHLIQSYQVNGHLGANLDPLGLTTPETFPYHPQVPDLTKEYHGFTEADMDRQLYLSGTSSGGNTGYLEELAQSPNKVTLRMILDELHKTYCGALAVEYMHISSAEQKNWIRSRIGICRLFMS